MTYPFDAFDLLCRATQAETALSFGAVVVHTYQHVLKLGVAPEHVSRVGTTAEALVEAHFHPEHRPLAIYWGDELAGLLVYARDSAATLRLRVLLVDAAYAGRGIGTATLRAVRRIAAMLGAHRVIVDVLEDAPDLLEFYRHRGFGPAPEDGRIDRHVRLVAAILL